MICTTEVRSMKNSEVIDFRVASERFKPSRNLRFKICDIPGLGLFSSNLLRRKFSVLGPKTWFAIEQGFNDFTGVSAPRCGFAGFDFHFHRHPKNF